MVELKLLAAAAILPPVETAAKITRFNATCTRHKEGKCVHGNLNSKSARGTWMIAFSRTRHRASYHLDREWDSQRISTCDRYSRLDKGSHLTRSRGLGFHRPRWKPHSIRWHHCRPLNYKADKSKQPFRRESSRSSPPRMYVSNKPSGTRYSSQYKTKAYRSSL